MNTTLKSLLWLASANGATKMLWALTLVLLMRGFGPEGYGFLATAWALGFVAASVADVGCSQAMLRAGSRHPSLIGAYLRKSLAITTLTSFPLLAMVGGCSLALLVAPVPASLVMLALTTPFVDRFQTLCTVVPQIMGQIQVYSVWRTTYFLTVLLAFFLILHMGGSFQEVILVFFGITLIFTVLYGRRIVRLIDEEQDQHTSTISVQQVLRESRPFFLINLLTVGYYRVDVILLGFMDSDRAAGIYSAQCQIILLFYSVSSMILTVLYPNLYRGSHDRALMQRHLNRIWRYLSLLAVLVTPPTMVYARDIMVSLGGQPFSTEYQGLIILALLILVCPMMVAVDFLTVLDEFVARIRYAFMGIITVILGGILVIPHCSVIGMASVAVVSYTLPGILSIRLLVRKHGFRVHALYSTMAQIFLTSVPAFLIFLVPLPWFLCNVLGFMVGTLICLTWVGFWDDDDKRLLARLMHRSYS